MSGSAGLCPAYQPYVARRNQQMTSKELNWLIPATNNGCAPNERGCLVRLVCCKDALKSVFFADRKAQVA